MKKKINVQLIGISIASIIITMFLMTVIFYEVFERQVRDDLELEARILKEILVFDETDKNIYRIEKSDFRITWVEEDGTVLYDNDADASKMSNHKNRPEIAEAMEKGAGEAVRNSATMNTSTFYYAIRLDNGSILRVSRETKSVWYMILSALPSVGILIIAMIGLSVLSASLLTKKLLAPIEEVVSDMDHFPAESVYKELRPLVNTIRSQHENILDAAKMRQDFTANVSHELKTPLAAISGYAELIENKMVQGDQTIKFAEEIRHNAERLLSLINDIINLSELDRMEDTISFESVDLHEIAENCCKSLKVHAEQSMVKLYCAGDSCPVLGDRNLLDELITNLVENAIRYNKENGIVEVMTIQDDGNSVLVVKDTGIGIPQEHQDRIFERFYRVDKSRSKQTGGTGLGLAIVKHIVAIHEATIELESEVGKGTTIRVVF